MNEDKRLSELGFYRAAQQLECEEACVRAVVEVESVEPDTNKLMFTLKTFDENYALLEIKHMLLNNQNLDDFATALHKGIEMLQLKDV